jgi:hypothetical protein
MFVILVMTSFIVSCTTKTKMVPVCPSGLRVVEMQGEPRVSRPTAERILSNNQIIETICGDNVPWLDGPESNKIIGHVL